MPDEIDIGGGHFIKFCEYKGDTRCAIKDRHLTKDGKPCQGFVAFAGGTWAKEFPNSPAWTVESFESLTISPSMLCRTCGDHGFIRNGRWVTA